MDLRNIIKRLNEYAGTRIAEKELRDYLSISDYEEYYDAVAELLGSNIIAPVKSSGSNGMRPPLHKRYAIVKQESKSEELIPEIRLLHNKLNIEGYLMNPEKYKAHKKWLSLIDCFLKNTAESLEDPMSVNERSFQIFQREKALKEDKELAVILNFNTGLREALNCYPTPEPFFTYNIVQWEMNGQDDQNEQDEPQEHPEHHEHPERPDIMQELNILIIENKDTWYTLRGRMHPNCSCIGGIRFDSLIYGEGKKICRKIDSLTEYDRSYFKGAKTNYYYFGDLDFEGVGIVRDLIDTNPTLQIKLMKPLYIAMLDASKNSPLPVTKEKQNKKAVEWFVSLFETDYQERLKAILESGRYIPQEILNNKDFIGMINGD